MNLLCFFQPVNQEHDSLSNSQTSRMNTHSIDSLSIAHLHTFTCDTRNFCSRCFHVFHLRFLECLVSPLPYRPIAVLRQADSPSVPQRDLGGIYSMVLKLIYQIRVLLYLEFSAMLILLSYIFCSFCIRLLYRFANQNIWREI